MKNLYCLKCRAFTQNSSDPRKATTSNGRHMLKTTCKKCGTKKSVFTK